MHVVRQVRRGQDVALDAGDGQVVIQPESLAAGLVGEDDPRCSPLEGEALQSGDHPGPVGGDEAFAD
jgi:hypothetical protein